MSNGYKKSLPFLFCVWSSFTLYVCVTSVAWH